MSRKNLYFRIVVALAGLGLFLYPSFIGAEAQDGPLPGQELLKSGDFSDVLRFNLYTESGGNAVLSIENGELQVDVSKIGRVEHAIQPYYDGFRLYEGVEYQLDFDAHASMARDLYVRIQLNGGDYHAYFEKLISVTEENQHFSLPFVMKEATDPAPRLCVNMGFVDAMSDAGLTPDGIEPHKVWFDNFSLTVKDVSGMVADGEESKANPIRINQVGYLPDAVKTAVIADLEADSFTVVRIPHGGTVFEGLLSEPEKNPSSGEMTRVADFTGLKMVGKYKIITSDGTVSDEFTVSRQAYDNLLRETLKMLFLTDPALTEEDAAYMAAKALLNGRVQQISTRISTNTYGINRMDQFEWGSNMGIANDGVVLMMSAFLFEDDIARAEAARQLDYLLGENATGFCYVSGFGSKSPVHPHHRPSTSFGVTVPGMLVGGPDSNLEDPYAQNVLAGCFPAKCYADNDQSYSTNEVCVYWNSPLILLISALTL